MKQTPGFKRIEKEILERINSLSRRLLTCTEKDLFKIQGELLGIQSVLSIIDLAIEEKEESKKRLKGD